MDGLDLAHIVRVITLQDYNTRVVVIGTMLLGLAAGVVGTYMLLRKRALVGDVLSHATLPGIAIAFIVMVQLGGTGKALPGLLLGAVVSGLIGVGAILLIKGTTRIREDAALGIVLSVWFGLGVALLSIIQKMPTGHQAGLQSFIYGKTASMLRGDAIVIAVTALIVVTACGALYKELAILSFDSGYARSQGWPTTGLDLALMLLVTAVTVVGLQAVGLILIIALLIIPPAAARFWTNHLRTMIVVAAGVGGMSGLIGAGLSAMTPRLPAGAIIVVVAATIFLLSLLFGVRRGVIVRHAEHRRLTRRTLRQHLLRAMFEWLEAHARAALEDPGAAVVPRGALLAARSWSPPQLDRVLRRAGRDGLVEPPPEGGDGHRLTAPGLEAAARVTRNHRLWETFLVTHADIAPSHVDRDADQIEHVLGPRMIRELERVVDEGRRLPPVPPSPHALEPPAVAEEASP